MPQQGYKNITIDVPQEWQDKTVLAFAAPPRAGKVAQPNVVVTRDSLPVGQSIRTYGAKQLAELAKALREFELLDSREVNVGGLAGVEYRFTWEGDAGPIFQRMLLAPLQDTVVTVTASAPKAEATTSAEVFDKILASVSFGPAAGGAARPLGTGGHDTSGPGGRSR